MSHVHDKIYLTNQADFGVVRSQCENIYVLVREDIQKKSIFLGNSPKQRTPPTRPAQLAELPRSKFDPELFPHIAYVDFFVTFATKVPYLTFCDKI